MKIIEIRTQAELDALPKRFEEPTRIKILGGTPCGRIVVRTTWGSAHVEARGSAHVEAWESAHVEAWESAHVEAWGNALLRILNDNVQLKIYQQVVAIAQECSPKILHQDQSTQLLRTVKALHDLNSFLAIKEIKPTDGKVTLYKYVRDNFKDHYSGTLNYEPGNRVTEPEWDPNPERQCGKGLHLSASLQDARRYNSSGRAIACEVALEDIVIYGPDITKVRCRKVTVINEVQND